MRVLRDAATDPMSGTTETKQLEESPINDGNPVDAVLNNSNESIDDINETYAGRDLIVMETWKNATKNYLLTQQ